MKMAGAMTAGILLLAGLSGCGYTTGSSLSEEYQSIHVSPFQNASKEYDLQAPLTTAVTRKFIADTRLRVVSREEADLLAILAVYTGHLCGRFFRRESCVGPGLLCRGADERRPCLDAAVGLRADDRRRYSLGELLL